jgi:acetyl-CoA C-acetyltransferase
MSLDPSTPVIVGVGQAQQRPADPADAREPVDLLAVAAQKAAADSGAASLLDRVDAVAVMQLVSWSYPDPGAALARRLGISPRTTITTTVGGNSPQMALNRLAPAIARGDHDVVLLGGVECVHTRWRARRPETRTHLAWSTEADPPCPIVWGDDRPGSSQYEMAHLAVAPTQVYPLFETALRAAAGHGTEEHQRFVSELWARFAAVAADNPNAASRVAFTAEEIRTVTPDNRMIAFPYPKRMCANIDVDQAAALILCSYERARDAGVADDRLVFPLAGADAADHYFFTERDRLADSPAMRAVASAVLDAAGLGVDDVARFDLYSCFPSAVQLSMAALGLGGLPAGDARPLTVTGGLGFAGGPGNDYVTHSIAEMVRECRQDPGSVGLVTALGWYATKHSAGLYSSRPPTGGFARVDPAVTQAAVDALPARVPAGRYAGPAEVEATSVAFERDGSPGHAVLSALTPDGRRALATTHDADLLDALVQDPWEGRTVRLRTEAETNVLEP